MLLAAIQGAIACHLAGSARQPMSVPVRRPNRGNGPGKVVVLEIGVTVALDGARDQRDALLGEALVAGRG